jgi:uncharacterized membrane protein (DUF485 family)
MANDAAPGWRFLYREERGTIDAAAWRRGFVALALPMLAMTILWFSLLPYANRDLDERKLVDPVTLGVYFYLLVYAAAILLAAICFYFLSAKRWRDLGREPALAAAPLLAALIAGAAAWLQPRVSEDMPWAIVGGLELVLLVVAVWQGWALGFGASKPGRG